MPTLFEELKNVSQYIEIVNNEKRYKMSFGLFNKKHGVWKTLSDQDKIKFYQQFPLPEKFHAKIFLAYIFLINGIVTEEKNNIEVSNDVTNWFDRN